MKRFRHLVLGNTLAGIASALVIAIALLPVLWGLSTSLKPAAQILTFPPRWLPDPPTLASYVQVWQQSNFPTYFRNSVVVTLAALAVALVVSVHAAYAMARFRFRGKNLVMVGLLATSMIPGIAILVPLYDLSVHVKLYDTFAGLVIVYAAWNVPILVWLLRGFFESVPIELEEAARIDGCSRLRAFYRIVLPMSQPGLLAAAIMVIMFVWNDFLIAFALTISEQRRLLSVGLYTYISNYGVEWGQLTAATIIALLPVVAVFFLLQRRLVEGLMAGALKG
jgi:ABC-type glycerol-3-phosphate transport system permease component